MNDENVTITKELLDAIVDALTHLPYREVQPVFMRLSEELTPKDEIIHPH